MNDLMYHENLLHFLQQGWKICVDIAIHEHIVQVKKRQR